MKVSTKITYGNIEELASVELNVRRDRTHRTHPSQARGVGVVLFFCLGMLMANIWSQCMQTNVGKDSK